MNASLKPGTLPDSSVFSQTLSWRFDSGLITARVT